MRITTFMMEGTAEIPALRTAMTKGDALASEDEFPMSAGSVYGTKQPTMVRLTM